MKSAMLDLSELIACCFPLWKRGTEGDLQKLSIRERLEIRLDPALQRGK